MRPLFRCTLLAVLFVSTISGIARAATETWNPGNTGEGGSGTWDTGITANWNSGQTWTDGNGAVFTGTGGTITLVSPAANSLSFSATGPYLLQSGTLILTGSALTINSAVTIASTISATTAGIAESGTGSLTLTGSTNLGTNGLVIGTGAVDISGGGAVFGAGMDEIGDAAGTNGAATVTGSGSQWTSSGVIEIGGSGHGTLEILSGGSVTDANVVIGAFSGANGMASVSGTGSAWFTSGTMGIGQSGGGALVVTNGGGVSATGATVSTTGTLALGENVTFNSPLAVSGGTVTLVDGTVKTIALTNPVTITKDSTFDFDAGAGSDEIAFSGSGSISVTGTALINIYGISGQVTSGTDILISATTSHAVLGNVYNSGNFTYKLASTSTAEELVVTSTTALTTAYWKGTKDNIWSILLGGTATNWVTTPTGTTDPHLTPSVTTNVIFSGTIPSNEGDTVLGTDMTIASLTVSNTNAVSISGSDTDPLLTGTDTLTIAGISGITVNAGAGAVTIGADLYLSGSSQTVTVSNTGGLLLSGSIGSSAGLTKTGTGTLTVTGSGNFAGQTVTISGGTLQISNGGTVTDNSDIIGNDASGSLTVTGSGSTLIETNSLLIGNAGESGTLQILNEGAASGVIAYIGGPLISGSSGNGTAIVSGTGSTWQLSEGVRVGYNGVGSLEIINGGTVIDEQSDTIGFGAGSAGTVTVSGSGSQWTNTQQLFVGSSGTGTLLITNGGAVSTQDGYIANISGGTGSVTVSGSGGASKWTAAGVFVGETGTGTLLITNGGAVIDEEGAIGDSAGSLGTATVTGTGSTWTNSGALYVGNSGTGTLTISGGGAVTNGSSSPGSYIGYSPGSLGTVTVTGSGSAWTDADGHSDFLYVGDSGTGTLTISNGGSVSATYLGSLLAFNPGSSGTVTVTGSGSKWTNSGDYLIVGTSGTGTLTISNGGSVSSLSGNIGYQAGSGGTVTVTGSGSAWTVSEQLFIGSQLGYPAPGLLIITNGGSFTGEQTAEIENADGTLALGQNATFNSALNDISGTITLVDGQVHAITLTNPIGFTNNGVVPNVDFDVGNGSDQIILSGAGSLAVDGTCNINLYGISGQVTPGTDVLIIGTSANFALGNVYNSGNFTYSLLSTATSEDVVVTATSALTTAYWKGGQNNIWSILVGGTATNWTTDQAGTIDPQLTPSATTDVNFSAATPANEGNTVLGLDMTIKSLTVSDTNTVIISGSDPNPLLGTNTLTISGSSGTTGITVNGGAGLVTISANLYLSGSSQTVTVNNAAGVLVSGSFGSSNGLTKVGAGTLTLTGTGNFTAGSGGQPSLDVEFGTLAIQSGGSVTGYYGYIGENTASNGAVTVSGSDSTWTSAGALIVGANGNGTLTITNGGAVTSLGDSFLAQLSASSTGLVTVSGSGSTWTSDATLYVGESGTGTLSITNGGAVSASEAYIGDLAGSTGAVTVSGTGSTLAITSNNGISIGSSGSGTLQITNGGVVSSGSSSCSVAAAASLGSALATVTGTGSAWTGITTLVVGGASFPGTTGFLLIANGGLVSAAATDIEASGTLAFGANPVLNSPLTVNGGTVTLANGQLQTITLTEPATILAGSNLDFDVGAGSDEITYSGSGSLTVSGTSMINVYGLSGLVTSGTDILITSTESHLSLGNVYNGGNFTYKLVGTSTAEELVVTATTALTTAYWKGTHDNIWSILVNGTASNWVTTGSGTTDTHLAPSSTTNVIFSGTAPANEGNTVLGTSMTIASLTVNGTNAVSISGSDSNPTAGNDTLTISGTGGIIVNAGAGAVTIGANVELTGSAQTITVSNTGGLLISGTLGGTNGLVKTGTGALTITGIGNYAGSTTVSAGTVLVTGSISGSGSVSVATGAGLEVDGMLSATGTTTVSGTLSGIGSTGALLVNGGGEMAPGLTSAAAQALGYLLMPLAGGSYISNPAEDDLLAGRSRAAAETLGPTTDLVSSSDGSAASQDTASLTSPDPEAGTLTVSGNVTLSGSSVFAIRLGVNVASDHDELNVTNGGTVSLNGATLQLTIGSVVNNPANVGLTYVIINGGAQNTGSGFSNTFAQGSTIDVTGGYVFNILYASNAAGTGSGSDVVLQLTQVPEPGAGAILLLAVPALLLRIRRKAGGRKL